MKRVLLFILLSIGFALGLRAQMVNNIPNYLYSGSLGVGRNVANDANVYLQVGPNGAATKGMLPPRVADTAAITGTKRNGLLIYSNQLGAFAYFDSASVAWRRLGYTDTTVISTRAYAQNILDDSSAVLRALASTPDGVTSVATNTGTGITGGTITSTGTIAADTSVLSTKLWAEKAVDDTAAVLRTAINAINPSASLSSLTAATATNTINNANYNQTWEWNTLTGDALTLSSTSTAATSNSKMLEIISSGANASSNIIKHGIHSSVTNTGTSSTNYAGYFTASGGTSNTAIYAEGTTRGINANSSASFGEGVRGSVSSSSSSGVIGVASAASSYGVKGTASAANSYGVSGEVSATTGTNYGVNGAATGSGATTNYGGYFTASGASVNYGLLSTSTDYGVHGTATAQYGQGVHGTSSGADSYAGYFSNTGSTGVKYAVYSTMSGNGSNNYGLYSYISGAATTNYGTHSTTVGAGTTNVGGYFKAINATNNHALVTDGGNTGFGTTTPVASALVELSSTTQGLLLPRMTKTQRDAISSPATGLMVYQTDNTPGLRVYNGTNWMRFTETAD